MSAFDRAERAWLAAPEPARAQCRLCLHGGEDHAEDGRCEAVMKVHRWAEGATSPTVVRVRCDCPGFELRTVEDVAADAADAADLDGFWIVLALAAGVFGWLADLPAVAIAAAATMIAIAVAIPKEIR